GQRHAARRRTRDREAGGRGRWRRVARRRGDRDARRVRRLAGRVGGGHAERVLGAGGQAGDRVGGPGDRRDLRAPAVHVVAGRPGRRAPRQGDAGRRRTGDGQAGRRGRRGRVAALSGQRHVVGEVGPLRVPAVQEDLGAGGGRGERDG